MKVQFLKDTSRAKINLDIKKPLIVYRDGFEYKLPKIESAEYIEFLEYKHKYLLFEPKVIVLIGLNRIITPSNRCDMVNEYLQTMTPSTQKICIDTAPFIGEPWRLWFHYSVAACGKFNITYSYAIETEWEKWFYREKQDCRLSAKNIDLFITNTTSDLDLLRPSFEFFDVSKLEVEWYFKLKEQIFKKYNSPKLLINNILKFSNKYFNVNISYDSYLQNTKIIVPNLGIYQFVVEENIRRMEIYNKVVAYGRKNLY